MNSRRSSLERLHEKPLPGSYLRPRLGCQCIHFEIGERRVARRRKLPRSACHDDAALGIVVPAARRAAQNLAGGNAAGSRPPPPFLFFSPQPVRLRHLPAFARPPWTPTPTRRCSGPRHAVGLGDPSPQTPSHRNLQKTKQNPHFPLANPFKDRTLTL